MGNDLDQNVHSFWLTVADDDDSEWLDKKLALTPHSSEDQHAEACERLTDPDLPRRERAYWWIQAVYNSYGAVPGGRYARRFPSTPHPGWPNVKALCQRMQGVELRNRDAVDLLDRFAPVR